VRITAAIFAAVSMIAAGTTTAMASAPSAHPALLVDEDENYSWVADPDEVASGGGFSTQATWGACGIFDENLKVIRTFTDRRGGAGLPGGSSTLNCGSENWGYRHIVDRHLSQWQAKAAVARENWRDTADYGILWAFKDPDKVTYRGSNDTYCYSRKINLVNEDNGQVVGNYYPNVAIARVSKRIITAVPAGAQCR
jgi:hypothetical protein